MYECKKTSRIRLVFLLDTKLSSFQYVFVGALLSMYKYILFKSFGEVFSSNTTSVVKEIRVEHFIVLVTYRMSFTFIFLTSFSSCMKYFISERSIVCPSSRTLLIITRVVRRRSSSIFQTLHFQLSLYSIRFNYFSIVHCILFESALFLFWCSIAIAPC